MLKNKGLSAGLIAVIITAAIVSSVYVSFQISEVVRMEEEYDQSRIKETKMEMDHSKMLLRDAARFSVEWAAYELGQNETIWPLAGERSENEKEIVRETINDAFNYYTDMLEDMADNHEKYGIYSDLNAEGGIQNPDDLLATDERLGGNFTVRLNHSLDNPNVELFDEYTIEYNPTVDIPYMGAHSLAREIELNIRDNVGDTDDPHIYEDCELDEICLPVNFCIYKGWGRLYLMYMCKHEWVDEVVQDEWVEPAIDDANVPDDWDVDYDIVDLGQVTIPSACENWPCVIIIPAVPSPITISGTESYMDAALYAGWVTVKLEITTDTEILTNDGYETFEYKRRYREFPFVTHYTSKIGDIIPDLEEIFDDEDGYI